MQAAAGHFFIHCRVAARIQQLGRKAIKQVHPGGAEKSGRAARARFRVHCRRQLRKFRVDRIGMEVHCRMGSSKFTKSMAYRCEGRSLPHGQLRNVGPRGWCAGLVHCRIGAQKTPSAPQVGTFTGISPSSESSLPGAISLYLGSCRAAQMCGADFWPSCSLPRIGGSEKDRRLQAAPPIGTVFACRIGSSEMAPDRSRRGCRVHCRIGSSEKHIRHRRPRLPIVTAG